MVEIYYTVFIGFCECFAMLDFSVSRKFSPSWQGRRHGARRVREMPELH
jgi:hypothetical protein